MTLFQHQKTCTGGEWGKTHCAVYVEGAAHWCTFWWGARLHLAREDIDGITTRSSSWSRRDGRRTRPMWDQPHISSSSGRRRSHPPPRRPRRASGRQHYHGRWGWTWVGNYTFQRLSRHPWGLMWSYHSGGGVDNYPDWSNGAVGRRLWRGPRKEGCLGGGSGKCLCWGVELETRRRWAVTGHHCWPANWRIWFRVETSEEIWTPRDGIFPWLKARVTRQWLMV